MTISSVASQINDESLADKGGGWFRLSFNVEASDFPDVAFKTHIDVQGFSGTAGTANFGMPQVSDKSETEYYRTESTVKTGDINGPCF